MRKLIALLLTAVLLLSLAACGTNDHPGSTGETPNNSQNNNNDQNPGKTTEGNVDVQTGATPTLPEPQGVDNYFDDAAFVGDSVTLKLKYYHAETNALGGATFLCAGNYGVHNAVDNVLYVTYQGEEMTPQDALAACGAKKVFIMLGMNDIGLYGVEDTILYWSKLIENIRSKCPDIFIFIQSGTPIVTGGERGKLTNARMDEYNVELKKFCLENGCFYVDVATSMKDANGGLKKQYCSDNYVHMTPEGCQVWVEVLKDYLS